MCRISVFPHLNVLGFLAGLVVLVVIIGVTKPTACVHGKILPPVKKTTRNTNTVKDKKQTLKVKDEDKYKNIKVVIIGTQNPLFASTGRSQPPTNVPSDKDKGKKNCQRQRKRQMKL